jgi:hypothetical protein
VLARLREAAQIARTDPKAAIKAYEEIAAEGTADQVMGDFAMLRAGYLLVDTASYGDLKTVLEPLTGANRAFRHSARELLALSAWKAGDTGAARQWADVILTDPQSPPGARSRAEVLSQLISAGGKG